MTAPITKSITHINEMQVRWDQGQDRAGSQTHHKTTTEKHLQTHLSKSEWTLMSKQSKTKKSMKCRNNTYNSTSLTDHTHTHTHTPLQQPHGHSQLSNTGSSAKACLVFPNCKHDIGRGTKRKRSQNKRNEGLG